MKKLFLFCNLIILSLLIGCSDSQQMPLPTVQYVDVNRYIGKWYEIARLPFDRQKDCICTTAEYAILDKTTLSVINSCVDSTDGSYDSAEGKAFVVNTNSFAELKVQFFWPFKGDYRIIALDTTNYQYALVGNIGRKYAWILSRTPTLDTKIVDEMKIVLKNNGFNPNNLIFTVQNNCATAKNNHNETR